MEDIRKLAKDILAEVPVKGQITSNRDTAELFSRLTNGVTQKALEKNWAGVPKKEIAPGVWTAEVKPGKWTTCNEFAGWYATTLRTRVAGTKAPAVFLGRFDLDTYLQTIGMGHAWVKSTADVWPRYGDICRHVFDKNNKPIFHQGISLDFTGELWNHVDSGQGGPIAKCDIIKRTYGDTPYRHTWLQGWVDIELYYGSAPQTGDVPGWLLGWWEVAWRSQSYYYYFYPNRTAKWTRLRPRDAISLPLVADDSGPFTVDDREVTVRWSTGTVERYTRDVVSDSKMQGTWNSTEQITAERI